MISLSVPVYNEEGSIEELFEKVRTVMNRHGTPWEIIFVNDGSTDTGDLLIGAGGGDVPGEERVGNGTWWCGACCRT